MSQRNQKFFPYELLQLYRGRAGLTQAQLAVGVGLNGKRMVQYWEAGTSLPKADSLKKLIALFWQRGGFLNGKEKEEAARLWNAVKETYEARPDNLTPYPIFDEAWFEELIKTPKLLASISATPRPSVEEKLTSSGTETPHNLPQHLTSLVGRQQELSEVCQQLKAHRLLTLTGTGGVGKTRLALAASEILLSSFPQGVWLVELAPLTQEELLVQTVARLLRVEELPRQTVLDSLLAYLKSRKLLLVLDNCEHLLEGCARLVEEILRHCSQVYILATSRERLGLSGEVVIQVAPLSVPNSRDLNTISNAPEVALSKFDAIGLFAQRASLVLSEFKFSSHNARAVGQICQRLDGIPLAIELAVARLKVLPPEQLASRLDDRFRLLTGGSRTALPRQQTLQALIDWSYELLSEPEQLLFKRLAIFAGGWTLQAAEQICSDSDLPGEEVLDLLDRLLNKSLVTLDETAASPGLARYHFLETIRHYAWKALEQTQEVEQMRRRHLEWYTSLAQEAELHLKSHTQVEWVQKLEAEHDNLRLALSWALEVGEWELAGLICSSIAKFWVIRGYLSEGRSWFDKMIAVATRLTLPVKARVYDAAALIAGWQGDGMKAAEWQHQGHQLHLDSGNRLYQGYILIEEARKAAIEGEFELANHLFNEAQTVFKAYGTRWDEAQALVSWSNIVRVGGNSLKVESASAAALAISREVGDRVFIVLKLEDLAQIVLFRGDYTQATAYLDESRAIRQEWGHRRGAYQIEVWQGWIALLEEDFEVAKKHFKSSLAYAQDIGEKRGIYRIMMGLASLAGKQDQLDDAARLFGAATAFLKQTGLRVSADEEAFYNQALKLVKARLGKANFEKVLEQGKLMLPEPALKLAESIISTPLPAKINNPTRTVDGAELTSRELEVLRLVAQGLTNPQIARSLSLSPLTVSSYLHSVYSKLNLKTRAAATRYALEHKLTISPQT